MSGGRCGPGHSMRVLANNQMEPSRQTVSAMMRPRPVDHSATLIASLWHRVNWIGRATGWSSQQVFSEKIFERAAASDIPSVISEYLAASGSRAWQYAAEQQCR